MDRSEMNEPRVIIDFDNAFSNARAAQRLSVSEVARATRLPEAVIETIESGDFTHASTDVYMRGYINIYAKYLNLDENELLRRFDEQKPAFNQNIDNSVIAGYSDHHSEAQQHSLLFTLVTVVVALAILVAAYAMVFEGKIADYLGLNENKPTANVVTNNANTVNLPNSLDETINVDSSDSGTILPSIGSETNGEQDANNITETLPSADLPTSNDLPTSENSLPLVLENVTTPSSPDMSSLSLESTSDDVVAEASPNPTETSTPTENITVNEDGTTTMTMSFTNDCWLSIKDATGKTILTGTYKKGKSITVAGKLPFRIKIPRTWATKDVTLGGKKVKIENFPKRSGRYVLDN